ncbi:hepatoma-derived growth factor-related protein 2 [Drosophila obscura]|uniref:hepatoma-derived growth factor-related protein 2 n=1 Tax=Drosophila obscura TaxID=7282 RepID=UPI001BB132DD|nr:hepatoma-derived growth factor-related protein 2 [Drosophila obscura]
MAAYEDMSQKQPQRRLSSIWLLLLTVLLFVSTLTVVALIEAERAQSGGADVLILNRMWSHFQAATGNDTKEETATVERIAREASNSSDPTQTPARQSKDFYEEQRAVVVNAESMDPDPIVAQRQDSFGPPQSREDSDEQDPYYDAAEDYGPGHYPYQQEEQQQSGENFYGDGDGSSEGRAAQARPYDGFYAPWKPSPVATHPAADAKNRKLQAPPNRAPYPAYDEVYDYPMGFQRRPQAETALAKQAPPPQPTHNNAMVAVQEESTFVTVLKSLKQLWDLYQALMSAWNSMAERHQKSTEKFRKEQAEKQAEKDRLRQQQQQKMRVNSKKPPRIEGDKKNQNKKSTTTRKPTSTSSTTPPADNSEEDKGEEKEAMSSSTTTVKPEPQKGEKGEKADVSSVRGLRQRRDAVAEDKADTDVGEGRYIKGDPLKGYYDFVITEGSYKFWAVFQVGTALLIIYSTFAAIYYSKVNPLTSDYDYTDYLGGVRSLSGGDADFVDDADAPPPVSTTSRIMEWLPRTAHSVKFILDAIEKMPLDRLQTKEPGWGSTETAAAAETS